MFYKKTLLASVILASIGIQAQAACPTFGAGIVSNEDCRADLFTTPISITGTTFNNANADNTMPFKAIATTAQGLKATVNGVTALYSQSPSAVDVNLNSTPMFNMLFDTSHEALAAGPVFVEMLGINQITNAYPQGDATLYLRAKQGASSLSLAANSQLIINNAGKNGAPTSTESIFWRNSSEGLHIYANLVGAPNGNATLSMDPTAVLDITSQGMGLLADVSGNGQGQGNIDIGVNSLSKIKSTMFTSGSVNLAALAADQTNQANKGSIKIVSEANLQFLHGNNGKAGGAVLVNHAGNSLSAGQSAIDIKLMGANSKQIVTGDGSAGVRATAISGDVKIIADVDNKMYLDKKNVDGVYFGLLNTPPITIPPTPPLSTNNPANVLIENHGLIQITGELTGGANNFGLVSQTNQSDTHLKNTGTIFYRDHAKGVALASNSNFDGTDYPLTQPSPIVGKPVLIENSGTLAFSGSGIEFFGINANTALRGVATVTNSGNIYANKAAISVNAAKSTVVNTPIGKAVSYFSAPNSFEDTLTNQGTWIAKDASNLNLVNFNFGPGTATAPNIFENTGFFAVPGTAVANTVVIPVSPDLMPAIGGNITVSPTEAAATALTLGLGGTGNGVFKFGGTVDFKNATPTEQNYNLWTLDGDLNANGGAWLIDVALAGDAAISTASDSLVVSGVATTTTPVVLHVSNANGAGAVTASGIELISIAGNSPGTEFSLNGGSVSQGGYKYRLLRRPFAADGAVTGATWFLANINCAVGAPASNGDIAVQCTGLDKNETVTVPGGTCTYVATTSPAVANCTTNMSAIPPGSSVNINNGANIEGSFPIRGAGTATAIPSLNWVALLGLFVLLPLVSRRQRGARV